MLSGAYHRAPEASSATAYHFSIAECLSCRLVRTLPPPDPCRHEHGYARYGPKTGAGIAPDTWSKPIAAFLRVHAPGRRLIDVGCSQGTLVAAALDQGFDARGIDVDPVAIAAGQQLGRPVSVRSLGEIEETYDVAVLNHVLEHVNDLVGFLSSLSRILSPDGRVFMFVPYFRGLVPRLMTTNWIGWDPTEHVWHFTPETLERTVRNGTGFKMLSYTTKGAIEPPSTGLRGCVKRAVQWTSQQVGWGDQIEAIFIRPEPIHSLHG